MIAGAATLHVPERIPLVQAGNCGPEPLTGLKTAHYTCPLTRAWTAPPVLSRLFRGEYDADVFIAGGRSRARTSRCRDGGRLRASREDQGQDGGKEGQPGLHRTGLQDRGWLLRGGAQGRPLGDRPVFLPRQQLRQHVSPGEEGRSDQRFVPGEG